MSSLCLACCSTILEGKSGTYRTSCCGRRICSACLQGNPRLRQYNPCLACCKGIQVVGFNSKNGTLSEYSSPRTDMLKQEAAAFIIGEEEDNQEGESDLMDASASPEELKDANSILRGDEMPIPPPIQAEHGGPSKYWLSKGDSLQGIALRFNVNARDICKMNSLPFSTLSTNPQLLHTRSFVILPQTNQPLPSPSAGLEEREKKRKSERAAKQFQFVTKELDWSIAKAYVTLAEDSEDAGEHTMKGKEAGRPVVHLDRAESAVERYLDDEEWEKDQIKAGIMPRISPFPFFAGKA